MRNDAWEARTRRAAARLGGLIEPRRIAPEPRSVSPAEARAEHARRIMWRRLDEARTIRDRIAAGRAFAWEPQRLSNLVQEARAYARVARALTPRSNPLQKDASGLSYTLVNNHRNTDT
jgi:hypothetical protein